MNDGKSNHGFLWILQNEQKYRSVFVASSDFFDQQSHPKLVVTYQPMKKYFYLKDHVGDIRVTVDENGDVKGYNDYYPFGLRMPGRSMNTALNYALYKYSSKELDEENGINWYYFGARYYDPVIGRWLSVDPMEGKHPDYTPYAYVYNQPTKLIDLFGLDSTQRAKAVEQMQKHIDEHTKYEWSHSYSTDPNGTEPGGKGNCSSTASNCVVVAGEPNPSRAPKGGDKGSGVLNMEANTYKISDNEVQPGNLITFKTKPGSYHVGIVISVEKNKSFTKIIFGHNESRIGAHKSEFILGDRSNKWNKRLRDFYKWDTKPDVINLPDITIKINK